jgi:4,5-DOPA dioxygenase extradiol
MPDEHWSAFMSDPYTSLAGLPATPRMPVLFVGHGTPMNAIEDNAYNRAWRAVGDGLPIPRAILCVSAHWTTRGVVLVHVGDRPKTIHDFWGFPAELYAQQYPAPGAPDVARATIELVRGSHLEPDETWGLDHGAWSVLMRMFPKADIPVFQLSLDLARAPRDLLDLARELKPLRERGVLIIGSGNIVHNLRALAPGAGPYDWAESFDAQVASALERGDTAAVADALSSGREAQLANPTPEHFLPLLFAAGAADAKDTLSFFNASFDMGSLSMRSLVLS